MAFDPVQKILAIGTQSGAIRLYPFHNGNEIFSALFQVQCEHVSKYLVSLSVVLLGVTTGVFKGIDSDSQAKNKFIRTWMTVGFAFLKCAYIMLHHNTTSFICFKVMPVVVLN